MEYISLHANMISQLVDQTGPVLKEYNSDQIVLLLEILYEFDPQINYSRLLPALERRYASRVIQIT